MANNQNDIEKTAQDGASKPAPDLIGDAKAQQKIRLDHQLHVNLIMFTYALPKAKAEIIAYAEGVAGLQRRLSK